MTKGKILRLIQMVLSLALIAVAVYYLVNPDRPLNVRFWTALLILGAACAGWAAYELATGRKLS